METRTSAEAKSPLIAQGLAAAAALLAIAACGSPAKNVSAAPSPSVNTEAPASAQPSPSESGDSTESTLVPGCKVFTVQAQNRFDPHGALERAGPSILARPVARIAGNQVIVVDGWKHTGTVAYPHNSTPIANDVWLHEPYANGWVTYAAVRSEATTADPTDTSTNLGPLVKLNIPPVSNCEIKD